MRLSATHTGPDAGFFVAISVDGLILIAARIALSAHCGCRIIGSRRDLFDELIGLKPTRCSRCLHHWHFVIGGVAFAILSSWQPDPPPRRQRARLRFLIGVMTGLSAQTLLIRRHCVGDPVLPTCLLHCSIPC
ncbi:hypothetical protein O9992_09500 [Vibrio lentus]|nr:hypothetical protein [Vibrio lentus]